jgi:hypothetical protein
MSRPRLTNRGKEYINFYVKNPDRGLFRSLINQDPTFSVLRGRRSFGLPYSNIEEQQIIFNAVPIDNNNNPITTIDQYVSSLIGWFDEFGAQFGVDSNILAAQAYVESGYITWNYSPTGALGISQFTTATIFDRIVNSGQFTQAEKDAITLNLEVPLEPQSYTRNASSSSNETRARATRNRDILHRNVYNNTRIMIKAQASLMAFIRDRNANYASSSLFAYNRGSGLQSNNFSEIIRNTINRKPNKTSPNNPNQYIQEGLTYVERIFNILGTNDGNGQSFGFGPDGLNVINFDEDEVLKNGGFTG